MSRKISRRVLQERLNNVEQMIEKITALPLADRPAFFADERNVWTVESCLRRALEALLDASRHILAKRFGVGVNEYKQIAVELGRRGVLNAEEQVLLRRLVGYRNRIVHFYHEFGQDDLYKIATTHLDDLHNLAAVFLNWMNSHPEAVAEDL
jgi:uncharacterized protein YutE (UPF0331/DUF86 family)